MEFIYIGIFTRGYHRRYHDFQRGGARISTKSIRESRSGISKNSVLGLEDFGGWLEGGLQIFKTFGKLFKVFRLDEILSAVFGVAWGEA